MSSSLEKYGELMATIRRRFDVIEALRSSRIDGFAKSESAAFHGRKIIEGIAFGCLVALENGIEHVPRDAKGQWNAEAIFKSLSSKKLPTLPSPSIIRSASAEEKEQHNVQVVVDGVAPLRMTHDDLISVYQDLHRWLHEINPYTEKDRESFCSKHEPALWRDIERVWQFVERHFISISGEGFFCVLRDKTDGQVKIVPLSRISEI